MYLFNDMYRKRNTLFHFHKKFPFFNLFLLFFLLLLELVFNLDGIGNIKYILTHKYCNNTHSKCSW